MKRLSCKFAVDVYRCRPSSLPVSCSPNNREQAKTSQLTRDESDSLIVSGEFCFKSDPHPGRNRLQKPLSHPDRRNEPETWSLVPPGLPAKTKLHRNTEGRDTMARSLETDARASA
jgi:hypothetical protein